MKHHLLLLAATLVLSAGCGDDPVGPVTPAAPAALTSQGGANTITLTWDAVGSASGGYNIYRSTDGTTFTLIAGSNSQNSYQDTIASPDGDGVFYTYRVTAVADFESDPSATTRCMHGIRLTNTAGDLTINDTVPRVVEGTVFLSNGNLTVNTIARLYLLEGSTLLLSQSKQLRINGWIQSLGTSSSPAMINCAGTLTDGQGWTFWITSTASNYNPADGSGCRLQYTILSNLEQSTCLTFSAIEPLISNCKFYANRITGGAYIVLSAGCGAWFKNNSFDKIALQINGVMGSGLLMEKNIFTGGFYSMLINGTTAPSVTAGQITNNVFPGSKYLFIVSSSGSPDIPLGGNYWPGGTGTPPAPNITQSSSTISANPYPLLSEAPDDVGPGW